MPVEPDDPFAPPRAPVSLAEEEGVSFPIAEEEDAYVDEPGIHNLWTVLLMGLLCSPFGGAALQGLNWWRVGERRQAAGVPVAIVVATTAAMVVGRDLGPGLMLIVYPLALALLYFDHQRLVGRHPGVQQNAELIEAAMVVLFLPSMLGFFIQSCESP